MEGSARSIANRLLSLFEEGETAFYILSNPDADGIATAAILTKLLEKYKITPFVEFANSLELAEIVRKVRERTGGEGVWIFADIGSATFFSGINKKIIIDHHLDEKKLRASKVRDWQAWNIIVSPEMLGIAKDESSSAFLAYLIARNVVESEEIALLAILGTLGEGLLKKEFTLPLRLREIANILAERGRITIKKDLVIPGKETLPLSKLLCEMNVLLEMGFEEEVLKEGLCKALKWERSELENLRWYELEQREKRRILSYIAKERLRNGQEPDRVLEMVGEVYLINGNNPGTHLHDCAEFSMLLNQCSEKAPRLAYKLCLNQSEENYKEIMCTLYPR